MFHFRFLSASHSHSQSSNREIPITHLKTRWFGAIRNPYFEVSIVLRLINNQTEITWKWDPRARDNIVVVHAHPCNVHQTTTTMFYVSMFCTTRTLAGICMHCCADVCCNNIHYAFEFDPKCQWSSVSKCLSVCRVYGFGVMTHLNNSHKSRRRQKRRRGVLLQTDETMTKLL